MNDFIKLPDKIRGVNNVSKFDRLLTFQEEEGEPSLLPIHKLESFIQKTPLVFKVTNEAEFRAAMPSEGNDAIIRVMNDIVFTQPIEPAPNTNINIENGITDGGFSRRVSLLYFDFLAGPDFISFPTGAFGRISFLGIQFVQIGVTKRLFNIINDDFTGLPDILGLPDGVPFAIARTPTVNMTNCGFIGCNLGDIGGILQFFMVGNIFIIEWIRGFIFRGVFGVFMKEIGLQFPNSVNNGTPLFDFQPRLAGNVLPYNNIDVVDSPISLTPDDPPNIESVFNLDPAIDSYLGDVVINTNKWNGEGKHFKTGSIDETDPRVVVSVVANAKPSQAKLFTNFVNSIIATPITTIGVYEKMRGDWLAANVFERFVETINVDDTVTFTYTGLEPTTLRINATFLMTVSGQRNVSFAVYKNGSLVEGSEVQTDLKGAPVTLTILTDIVTSDVLEFYLKNNDIIGDVTVVSCQIVFEAPVT